MKKLILSLSVILTSALIIVGCATSKNLAPGPYNGDVYLFNIDKSIVSTYQIVDAFLLFELNNNEFIKTNYPNVFDLANQIRQNAPSALKDVASARKLYVNYFKSPSTNINSFAYISNNLQAQVLVLQIQSDDIASVALSTSLSNSFISTLKSVTNNTSINVNSILPVTP